MGRSEKTGSGFMPPTTSEKRKRRVSNRRLAQLRRAGQASIAARKQRDGDRWWYASLSKGWATNRVRDHHAGRAHPAQDARFTFALRRADLEYLHQLSQRTGVSQSEL